MSDDFKEKYINPFTDYGFKRLFGEEPSKDLLLDFLNELVVAEQGKIQKLTYLKSDRLGSSEEDRKAIFDLYCENENVMPKFTKTVNELTTRFDKWMFIIRNLNKLDRIPEELRENIFDRLFEVAEIAKFTPEEVRSYEDSLKSYRDLKNSLDTAREEGEIKGRMEGKIEIVKEMLKDGESIDKIIKYTGLTKEEIASIRKDGL